jgi:hypothetical protein
MSSEAASDEKKSHGGPLNTPTANQQRPAEASSNPANPEEERRQFLEATIRKMQDELHAIDRQKQQQAQEAGDRRLIQMYIKECGSTDKAVLALHKTCGQWRDEAELLERRSCFLSTRLSAGSCECRPFGCRMRWYRQ